MASSAPVRLELPGDKSSVIAEVRIAVVVLKDL